MLESEDVIEFELSKIRQDMMDALNGLDVSGLEFIISVCESLISEKVSET